MAIDVNAFRTGMRRLAGHVCLVTTVHPNGERAGLTATAVCSVSAEPPTILICVNRQNSSHAVIRESKIFAVNVLALEDQELANRFASRIVGEERFNEGLWTTLETGAPVLESALVSFDCRIAQAIEVGTHGIVFGAIEAIRVRQAEAKPLLYVHGSYGGFASAGASMSPEVLGMPTWGQIEN
ncbi:flavin reductase family protein [Caballeronia sordidicola]|jgi:flavin reductase (NADH)/flavin reductase|uniref:Putative flavin reductase RutF in pyrimidine catabolism pathway n=1 Tax=Caballeronia sordidicola TaxID=196367 RepID=A0A226X1F2_CABSO|nr:flavin reductase family protein [Caballeronia sordidicola]OXC76718.1 putative flavin reductase RutF in pyrimidine catabolism pathway [Caballeronia sordidicola]